MLKIWFTHKDIFIKKLLLYCYNFLTLSIIVNISMQKKEEQDSNGLGALQKALLNLNYGIALW